MPEQDGNTLPSEQQHFNLNRLDERSKQADELLNLGLKGLNRVILPFVLEASVFHIANKNYQQAVECFRYGLFEAAMVMARATIDAALYESKYEQTTEIKGYQGAGGTMSSTKTAKGTRAEGMWNVLSEHAKEIGLSLDIVDEVRDDYGNFAAHNAARSMEELHKYILLSEEERKTAKPPKWFIKEEDAYLILEKTATILTSIRSAYSQQTIKRIGSAQA